jgi:hypothetical protein
VPRYLWQVTYTPTEWQLSLESLDSRRAALGTLRPQPPVAGFGVGATSAC